MYYYGESCVIDGDPFEQSPGGDRLITARGHQHHHHHPLRRTVISEKTTALCHLLLANHSSSSSSSSTCVRFYLFIYHTATTAELNRPLSTERVLLSAKSTWAELEQTNLHILVDQSNRSKPLLSLVVVMINQTIQIRHLPYNLSTYFHFASREVQLI